MLAVHRGPELNYQIPHKKKTWMWLCTCNLSAGDVEMGGSLRLAGHPAQPTLQASSRTVRDPVSKQTKQKPRWMAPEK